VVELGAPGAASPSSAGPPVTELDATLGLRALGQTAVHDLARTSAATTEPELTLEFPSVDIPAGVHNLVVELAVRGRAEGAAPTERSERGYSVLHYARGGLAWWLVSDASVNVDYAYGGSDGGPTALVVMGVDDAQRAAAAAGV
jgi:hypothetical protein